MRYGDVFSRGPPPRWYSPPPPVLDHDREQERGRPYYPTCSPPPFCGDGVYDPDGERRFGVDREHDVYEQRRQDWYAPGDDDKRGPPPPPPASWRPHDRPPFMDRDRERFDRDRERDRDIRDRDWDRERDRDLGPLMPPPLLTRGHWDERDRRVGFPLSPPPMRMDTAGGVGPGRSLSARLTDPYPPPPGSDDRAYKLPPREFDRGRYSGPPLDDHAHSHGTPPPPFSRVRDRSLSPPRCGPGLADDLRPPVKRVQEDSGPGYPGVGKGGPSYLPARRGVGIEGGGGEYAPGPPPSSAATSSSVVTSVGAPVTTRSAGTRTPPVSAPLPSSGAFCEWGEQEQHEREREREREQEYVHREYGMGYDRDERGRRSPLLLGSRMGPPGSGVGGGGGYGRGMTGDRRDDRRYVPPPPPRTSSSLKEGWI